MNLNFNQHTLSAVGLLLVTATSGLTQELERAPHYLDDTNRLTASLRMGFNIKGKFKGVGSSFTTGAPFGAAHQPLTPDGDNYNYDNGYVLTDISGNAGGMTTYWGFDDASQVNGNTVAFDRTVATDAPGSFSDDDSPYIGAEVAYNYLLGVKEDWHHMRYGLEGAVNFMPINFSSGGSSTVGLSTTTDTYTHDNSAQDLVDNSPYQGAYGGPGFLLNVPGSSAAPTIGSGNFTAHEDFDSNLWGFRLGPYAEWQLDENFSFHLSAGLAVGLVDANVSWNETLTPDIASGLPTLTDKGSDSDLGVLWGGYVGAEASYRFNEHWSATAGAQFQSLGTYDESFGGGRKVELDLSKAYYISVGLSYSF